MKALGRAALAGIAIFFFVVLALHVFQPELNPRDEAVSYYAHGRWGWLLAAGLIGLGLASLALLRGLSRAAAGTRVGRALLGVWGVGVLLGGIFRADPPGRWSEPPSLAGMIHGNAAIVAFVALPIAALLLQRSFRQRVEWRPSAGLLAGLALATAIGLALFMASLVPVFVRPGPPILLGLTERLLLAAYAAWLAGAAVGLARDVPRAAGA